MKIRFIEPRSPNLHIFSRFKLPRLGAILLATIAKNAGHDTRVYVEEISDIDWEDIKSADLVGISTITATAPRAYAMADKIKKEGGTVVMGGPHVTYLPEEAISHSDFVLTGEAEHTFVELLSFLENKGNIQDVHNLCYKEEGQIKKTPQGDQTIDVDTIGYPDFNLVHEFSKGTTILNKTIIPVQISRGCPFDCSFCSVTRMFGRKMRYRETENILNELLSYNTCDTHIFFYDDNFAARPERAKELLRAMKTARTRFSWSTQLRIDASKDPELLQLMKETNCIGVYVGIESVDNEGLKQIKKQQTTENVLEGVRHFKNHGITVHGMFILGLDTDTKKVAKSTYQFALKSGIDSLQALILTPLPGSRVYDEMVKDKRLVFTDWALYDAHHVVYRPKSMTPRELQQAQIYVHARFYSRRRILSQLFRGQLYTAGIASYADQLNRKWKKINIPYLRALKLLEHSKEFEINMDLRVKCPV